MSEENNNQSRSAEFEVKQPGSIEINESHTEEILRAGGFLKADESSTALLTDTKRFDSISAKLPLTKKTIDSSMFESAETTRHTAIVMTITAEKLHQILFKAPSLRQRLDFMLNPSRKQDYLQLKLSFVNDMLQELRQINIDNDIYIGNALLSRGYSSELEPKIRNRIKTIDDNIRAIQNWTILLPQIQQNLEALMRPKNFQEKTQIEGYLLAFKDIIVELEGSLPSLRQMHESLSNILPAS